MKRTNKVKKAVIPIAGLGTRMLPATKAIPKEMLPISGKPIIQHIIEESFLDGFKEAIFVTHSSKYSVENHFDKSFELEATLKKRVKRSLLKEIKAISKLDIEIHSVRQGEARGLGHAVLCAESIVGDEPFAVILPDMIIQGADINSNLSLMKKAFEDNKSSSILLDKVQRKEVSEYGIVKLKKMKESNFSGLVEDIIEKPPISKAPSNLIVAGRYMFPNEFFKYLSRIKPDKNDEIQLTDAIYSFIKDGNAVNGCLLNGTLHDCGNKLGYLKANIEYAIEDKSISKQFINYLRKIKV